MTLASEVAPWPEARCLCSRQPHVCSWVKRGRGGDTGGGRGSFFFMSTLQFLRLSSASVVKAFSSAKHFNTINLYKSSFALYLSLYFSPILSSPLSLVGLATASLLCDLSSLSGPLNGRQASIAAARGSCIIFMSLAVIQGIIFIPVLIERCTYT